MELMRLVALAIGYAFGLILSGYLFGKKKDVDIRKQGSGNIGTTNTMRILGIKVGALTLVCDCLKCVAAVVVVWLLFRTSYPEHIVLLELYGALGAILGHDFPFFMKFKGGKGILSGGPIAIMMDWRIALVVWGGFLVLVVLTRYVSLGSCFAGASFPFATWFVYQDATITVLAVVIGGLILYMHRGNIHRLLTGTENKLSLHKKK